MYDDDFVKVENGVELVGYGNDRVMWEVGTDKALYMSVRGGIKAAVIIRGSNFEMTNKFPSCSGSGGKINLLACSFVQDHHTSLVLSQNSSRNTE